MVGPAAKREAVAHLQAVMGLSERRACSFVGADRKMIRYQSCRPPETELRGRLRDLANERRRFGYRRLFVPLRATRRSVGKHLRALVADRAVCMELAARLQHSALTAVACRLAY